MKSDMNVLFFKIKIPFSLIVSSTKRYSVGLLISNLVLIYRNFTLRLNKLQNCSSKFLN